jgi:hypothetical protein
MGPPARRPAGRWLHASGSIQEQTWKQNFIQICCVALQKSFARLYAESDMKTDSMEVVIGPHKLEFTPRQATSMIRTLRFKNKQRTGNNATNINFTTFEQNESEKADRKTGEQQNRGT